MENQKREENGRQNQLNALAQFVTKKEEIDVMLAGLIEASSGHFDTHPDTVNWADVGTLQEVKRQLTEVTNFMGIT